MDLEGHIEAKEGDQIAVWVSVSSDNPDKWPAIQMEQYGLAKPGQSYYNNREGKWVDPENETTGSYYTGNLVIRLLTKNIEDTDSFEVIPESLYTKNDGKMLITGVKDKTTTESFLKNFTNENLQVLKDGKILSGTDLVGTGTVVTDGEKEYFLVVKGDVNGDGKISSVDYIVIKRSITGVYLSVPQFVASDIDESGKISSSDYMKVKRYMKGGYEL